jgi:phosphate transport system substrate-binding protein
MKLSQIVSATGIFTAALVAQPATAQTVEIISNNGNASVLGVLVDIRPDKLVVKSKVGVISFKRDEVTCIGESCPVNLTADSDLKIAAPTELADIFVPLLVDNFAENNEYLARQLSTDGTPLDGRVNVENTTRNTEASESHSFDIQLTGVNDDSEANILVQAANGPRVFDLLGAGEASIIFSESLVTEDAVQVTQKSGGGQLRDFEQERTVAVDGYVVVTHPRSKVKSMSIEQISRVMAGEIDNWSTFGGPDQSINVYSFRPEAAGYHHIGDLILDPFGRTLSKNTRIIQSNRELTVAIEKDPYGIGIVSYSSVRDTRPIAIENECGMVIEPSAFNIKTEEYTLQNRITAYSRTDGSEMATSFVSYLDNPNLDNLVTKSGLISLSIIPELESDTRDRARSAVESVTTEASVSLLKQFVLDVTDTSRLSTTFRFAPRSASLDNKARRDLARVLRYIEEFQPKRLILAGFADSNGVFSRNLSLSESRAQSVLDQLNAIDTNKSLANLEVEIRGFGELGPVACNETFGGRSTNRRVEIWAE